MRPGRLDILSTHVVGGRVPVKRTRPDDPPYRRPARSLAAAAAAPHAPHAAVAAAAAAATAATTAAAHGTVLDSDSHGLSFRWPRKMLRNCFFGKWIFYFCFWTFALARLRHHCRTEGARAQGGIVRRRRGTSRGRRANGAGCVLLLTGRGHAKTFCWLPVKMAGVYVFRR